MTAVLLPQGKQHYETSTGIPLVGGKVFTYDSGTLNPRTTWADAGQIAPNANPVILDARGEAIIFWSGAYRVIVQDSLGNIVIPAIDGISDQNFTDVQLRTDLATTGNTAKGAAMIGFDPAVAYSGTSVGAFLYGIYKRTAAEIAAGVTPTNYGYPVGHVLRYGTNTTPGTTNMAPAIQAAHNVIVNSGIAGVVQFPLNGGTFKCNSQLTINAGWVSIQGNRSILDFSSLGNVAAITVIGGNDISGNPWNQDDCCIEGLVVKGPAIGTGTGIYCDDAATGTACARIAFRDFQVHTFKYGIYIANHAYMIAFDHFGVRDCTFGGIGPLLDLAGNSIVDSGENVRFIGGVFQGCDCNFYLEQGNADYNFFGTSFDFCNGSVYGSVDIEFGQASFEGCHFEEGAQRVLKVGANTFVTCTGCDFVLQVDYVNSIDNAGYLTLTGGRIVASSATGSVLRSTSRFTNFGTHLQSGSGTFTLTGNYLDWRPNDGIIRSSATLLTTGAVDASQFLGGVAMSLAVVNTWYNTGTGPQGGQITFQDLTSGGMAIFACDGTTCTAVLNNIGGFAMQYSGGQLQARITGGTAPRSVKYTFVATN